MILLGGVNMNNQNGMIIAVLHKNELVLNREDLTKFFGGNK